MGGLPKRAARKVLSKLRSQPGMSNAGKYPNVKSSDFAGPKSTFPINTKNRARNALARVHFAAPGDRTGIKTKVYAKYPELKEI